MGVCKCSMFCCTLLYVHSSIAIILMGKRELIDLLNLSSWCLVMVERLFLAVPRGCLQFVIVVFPDHTHLLFFADDTAIYLCISNISEANIMQEDLHKLEKWDMSFNPSKCQVLHVSRLKTPIPSKYSLHNTELES